MIVCSVLFWAETHYKPFISSELNNLNFDSSLIMLLTIFLGLFSSICDDLAIQEIIIVVLLILHIYLFLKIAKILVLLKCLFANSRSKIFDYLNKMARKNLPKGTLNENLVFNFFRIEIEHILVSITQLEKMLSQPYSPESNLEQNEGSAAIEMRNVQNLSSHKNVPPKIKEKYVDNLNQDQEKLNRKIQKEEYNRLREIINRLMKINKNEKDFLKKIAEKEIFEVSKDSIVQKWETENIVSEFLGLKIKNRSENFPNEMLQNGVKKIKQEIINDTDSIITIEKIHFDSPSFFFFFYFSLKH